MSNSNKSSVQYNGIGFFGMLTILFIGLKLGNVITWSWWWVLAPIWGPIALVLAIVGLVLLGVGLVYLISYFLEKGVK